MEIGPSSFVDAAQVPVVLVDAGIPTVVASVPVTICKSDYGIEPDWSREKPPSSTAQVTIRSDRVMDVGLYSDRTGGFKVLGPRGWQCQSVRGANGTLEMSIEPRRSIRSGAWWQVKPTNVLILVKAPSFCCADYEACAIIPRAERGLQIRTEIPCGQPAPAVETIEWVVGSPTDTPVDRDTIVRFTDPPRVTGNGDGSGGDNPARGIILYRPIPEGNAASTRKLTCILPPEQSDVCEALVTDFKTRWGEKFVGHVSGLSSE